MVSSLESIYQARVTGSFISFSQECCGRKRHPLLILGSVLATVDIMVNKTKSLLLCSLHSSWGKFFKHIYI